MNTSICIIPYGDRYARDAIQMWRDSKQQALGIQDIHSFDDHLHFLRTSLIQDNQVFLAIDECYDRLVDLMAIQDSELNQLYVHVDYQGQGVDSRLLEIAKAMSPDELQLYTFEVNINAQAFYEKHGFQIIGRGHENEENLPDLRYEWTGDRLK